MSQPSHRETSVGRPCGVSELALLKSRTVRAP